MSDHDCVLACVKGGAKYVFVEGGKIYNVENQDFAGLEEQAGHTVNLTGEMKGDTIKVSKRRVSGIRGRGRHLDSYNELCSRISV